MPVLWLALSFALGITAAGLLPFALAPLAAACASLATLAFVFRGSAAATAIILAAFFVAGAFAFKAEVASVSPDRIKLLFDSGSLRSGEMVELTGSVTGGVERAPHGFLIKIVAESVASGGKQFSTSGIVRLFAASETPEAVARYDEIGLAPGTRITAAVELEREERFRNPGVHSRLATLDSQGTDATGTLIHPTLIRRVERSKTFSVSGVIFQIRDSLITKFQEVLSPRAAGIAIAAMLGNKHFLDAETAGVFREGGTFHILVISGLHITFLGGIAVLVVRTLTRRRLVQFIAVCGFLWAYSFAVGAEPPVIRASLMFTILWFAYLIHRSGSLPNAYGLCGLVLLAWRPSDLFTPSFQLTFVSVGAIVLAGFPLVSRIREIGSWTPSQETPFPPFVSETLKRFCETLYWNQRSWQIASSRNVWSARLFKSPLRFAGASDVARRFSARLFEALLISAIVQIAMLPLTVHYFHRVVPVSLVLNVWTGPLVALLEFVSSAAAAVSLISTALALPFSRLADIISWLMLAVPGQIADVSWFSFRVPVYSSAEPWIYIWYLLAVSVLGFLIYRWDPFEIEETNDFSNRRFTRLKNAATVLTIFLGFAIALHPFGWPRGDGRLHVEFIDVGQGDSTLITFPNGETMLIDAGGRRNFDTAVLEEFQPDRPSIGEMVVSEFLWEKGISSVDRIVATHADADHIEGFTSVIKNFRIGEAWLGPPVENDELRSDLEKALIAKGTAIRWVTRGQFVEIGGARVDVVHPGPDASILSKENDRSVVLRVTFGSRSFLFTGDIESAGEAMIIDNGVAMADVVKVPHHGSRSSSTAIFVNAIRPRFAVVPVGRRSHFGHPHPETMERWTAAGAEVVTTGERGTVAFSTNGEDLKVNFPVRQE